MNLSSCGRTFYNDRYSILAGIRSDTSNTVSDTRSLITQVRCVNDFKKCKPDIIELSLDDRKHDGRLSVDDRKSLYGKSSGGYVACFAQSIEKRKKSGSIDRMSDEKLRGISIDSIKKGLFGGFERTNGRKLSICKKIEHSDILNSYRDIISAKASKPAINRERSMPVTKIGIGPNLTYQVERSFRQQQEDPVNIRNADNKETNFLARLRKSKLNIQSKHKIDRSDIVDSQLISISKTRDIYQTDDNKKVEIVDEDAELRKQKLTSISEIGKYSRLSLRSKYSFRLSKKSRQTEKSNKIEQKTIGEKLVEQNKNLLWDSILLCYTLRQNIKSIFEMYSDNTTEGPIALYHKFKYLCEVKTSPNTVSELIFNSNDELKSIPEITEMNIMHYLIRGPLLGVAPIVNSLGSILSVNLKLGKSPSKKRKIYAKFLDQKTQSCLPTPMADMFKYRRDQIKPKIYIQCVEFNSVLTDFISEKQVNHQESLQKRAHSIISEINKHKVNEKRSIEGNWFIYVYNQANILEEPVISEIFTNATQQHDIRMTLRFFEDCENFKVRLNGNFRDQNAYLRESIDRLAAQLVMKKEYNPAHKILKKAFIGGIPFSKPTKRDID